MKTVTFFLSALSFVSLVVLPLIEAHGIIGQITIDGMSYQGPIAGGDPIPGSPVRQISDASPVKGANNIAITCGPDAKPASFVAPANPGSAIGVLWQANDRQHWPHNTGPFLTFPLQYISGSDRYLHSLRPNGSLLGFLRLRLMRPVRCL